MKDNKLFMIIVTVLAAIVLVLNIQKVISNNSQTDGYMKLTKEMEKDTYNKIKKVLKQVSDKNNTCYLDKGC